MYIIIYIYIYITMRAHAIYMHRCTLLDFFLFQVWYNLAPGSLCGYAGLPCFPRTTCSTPYMKTGLGGRGQVFQHFQFRLHVSCLCSKAYNEHSVTKWLLSSETTPIFPRLPGDHRKKCLGPGSSFHIETRKYEFE